ncbi:MAG: PcfB family protein [Clostridiales bacterium]|nr:PcfB family protein [Clostridiales bacterium]
MAIENETADQVVRMVLQGSEVVLRLTGEAALRIAPMIYAALKDGHTTKGKATLWEFLKSGKDQKLFRIPDEYLKAFTTASKKFGFPFVVLKDKGNKDGLTDILVYASDASKVNRVIENFNLLVKQVEVIKPEIKTETGELIKPLGMQLAVPLDLIDGIPNPEDQDKRLLAELQKYAAKMKTNGPQIVEPVGLLCKPDGRYEILPGQGSKRLMALRLANYKTAVADISVPKKEGIEVRAENIDERPPQERNEAPKAPDVPTEKDAPTKEDGQTANPTMARTSRDPASGQDYGQKSREDESKTFSADSNKRPSVRKKLEKAKVVAAEKQASKELSRMLEKTAPKPKR